MTRVAFAAVTILIASAAVAEAQNRCGGQDAS